MPLVVRSLILKGFRSLPNERIDFDNPTFLVGRNGAGKSNIGDALQFLSETMTAPLKDVLDRRGGIPSVRTKTPGKGYPRNLGIGVICEVLEDMPFDRRGLGKPTSARYSFEIGALPNYEFEVLREQCIVNFSNSSPVWFNRKKNALDSNLEPLKKIESLISSALAMPSIGGLLPFITVQSQLRRMKTYAIEPGALREMQDPGSGRDLRSDGRNAASVLEEIESRSPEGVKRIKEILSIIVPNTTDVSTIQHGKKLALEFTQEWGEKKRLSFEAFSMSDGTLRALGLLLAVFQVAKPSLIFVEEPEASIHPGAAAAILDTLKHASSSMQVVVSTHSPEILDAKWIQDQHIRTVVWADGATRVEQIPENAKSALRAHLMGAGELLRSNALEPSFALEPEKFEVALFEDL